MQRPNHCRCRNGPYLTIKHRPRSLLPPPYTDERPSTLTILCLECGTLFRTQAREHQLHPTAPTNWRALPTSALLRHWNQRTFNAAPPPPPPPTPTEQPPPAAQPQPEPAAAV